MSVPQIKGNCLECGTSLKEDDSCYCPKCRPMATKRDDELLDNMTYSQAEEIVMETLKRAVADLKCWTERRAKTSCKGNITKCNNEITELKQYIRYGLHREILERNPEQLISYIESEVDGNWQMKKR